MFKEAIHRRSDVMLRAFIRDAIAGISATHLALNSVWARVYGHN